MAFDGNGNWISNFSAVADRDANIKILASRFDNIFIADIAQSFENCLTKDAQVKPQQAFDANSYKVINVANPTNDYDAVNKQTLDNALNTTLATLYPVGSIYIGTQNTCPLATLISGSTWQLVATDKALWGGDGTNGNTTIAAGLPNITGGISDMSSNSNGSSTYTGAFKKNSGGSGHGHAGTEYRQGTNNVSFNASWSNSIYGNSSTVQPPAYRVNVWRRTA